MHIVHCCLLSLLVARSLVEDLMNLLWNIIGFHSHISEFLIKAEKYEDATQSLCQHADHYWCDSQREKEDNNSTPNGIAIGQNILSSCFNLIDDSRTN